MGRCCVARVSARRCLATLLLVGGVWASGAPIVAAQAESPFAIRVDAREVVVPVVVLDRTHRRMVALGAYEELDEEITDLAVKDFHIFEDGVEQPIDNIAMELPRIRDVRDNISHHVEDSFTPRGIWASPDLWPQSGGGLTLSPLVTYLVSYVPPESSAGTCHRIAVKVRHRHATVYARDEYCNVKHPLSDPVSGTQLGKKMEAFASHGDSGALPVFVQAGSFFGYAEKSRLEISVEFPWSEVKRKWAGVNLYAMVAILGVVRDRSGTEVARFSDMTSTVPWNFYRGPLPPDREFLKKWEAAGIPARYETQLQLAPGEYELDVVVTDGEKFGWKAVPVKVEGQRPDGFGIGDILLCRRFHEVEQGAQAAARAPQYVPLASNGLEFTPAGNARFDRNQPLVSYFEVYEPAGQASGEAKFKMRIVNAKTGEIRVDAGWNTVEMEGRSRARTIPIAAKLAIETLDPGAYVVVIQASDSTGKATAKQTKKFVIE